MARSNTRLFRSFPRLRKSEYQVCSPETPEYNCIAWAVERPDLKIWPDKHEQLSWPPYCPREETISAFTAAFRTLGFEPCEDEQFEQGFDKIALYAQGDNPKHAARQLPNGRWTSKLGDYVDIEHNLKDLEGAIYGQVVIFFRRSTQ